MDLVRLGRSLDPRVSLWRAYLVAGGVAVVAFNLLETGSLTQSLLYDAIGASAVAVALVGLRRNQPDRRLPWILLATGQALFVAGDLLWNWYDMIGESPFPSLADVLYLSGYPLLAVGLLMLLRRRLGDGDRGGLLDAAILTTATVILSWTFIIEPQLAGSGVEPVALMISLAYPVADLLLIGVAMGFLTTPGARSASFRMLIASLAIMLAADQIYAVQTLAGTYVSGGPIDNLYLVAYLLFGAAVAHPSMRRLTDPHPVPLIWLGPVRMACLAAAMVTGPIVVVVGGMGHRGMLVVAAGTALLSLLVLARLAGLVRMLDRDIAHRRSLEAQLSYQAFHDPLTGLTNRRRFIEAADAALAARSRPGTVAALFLDLDDFKTINDSLGHAAGDALLVAVADRLRGDLRSSGLAARLGGDEFGVLLTDVPEVAFAVAVSERLLAGLFTPIEIGGRDIEVGASLGIAFDSPGMRTADDLLGDADLAMYQAKALGKRQHHVFTPAAGGPASGRPPGLAEHVPTVRRPRPIVAPGSLLSDPGPV